MEEQTCIFAPHDPSFTLWIGWGPLNRLLVDALETTGRLDKSQSSKEAHFTKHFLQEVFVGDWELGGFQDLSRTHHHGGSGCFEFALGMKLGILCPLNVMECFLDGVDRGFVKWIALLL